MVTVPQQRLGLGQVRDEAVHATPALLEPAWPKPPTESSTTPYGPRVDDLWKALLAASTTLVVSLVLFRLEQGSRRRRRRREIREELALIAELEDTPVRGRLESRVADLLEAYEPDPDEQWVVVGVRSRSVIVADCAIGVGVIALAIPTALESDSTWFSLVIGAVTGLFLVGLALSFGMTPKTTRRRELGAKSGVADGDVTPDPGAG